MFRLVDFPILYPRSKLMQVSLDHSRPPNGEAVLYDMCGIEKQRSHLHVGNSLSRRRKEGTEPGVINVFFQNLPTEPRVFNVFFQNLLIESIPSTPSRCNK